MPSDKGPTGTTPTVVVSEGGGIAAGTRTSYRQGFADLLDLASPPARVAVLPPGAPTAIGFARTGQALHNAMATVVGTGSVKAPASQTMSANATFTARGSLTATTVKAADAVAGKTRK
jgi:hypothetical protein